MTPSAAHNGSKVNDRDPNFEVAISQVPVTEDRKPFVQSGGGNDLKQPGTARANLAASVLHPNGSVKVDWARRHKHQTVLQQHIAFFDPDADGIIWPFDTYNGFYALGFNFVLSFLALLIIHGAFSYVTLPEGRYLPDPFFRIYTANIHRAKHGSDTGTYDNEGRFVPQKFEDIFAKYAKSEGEDKDTITMEELFKMMSGQRVVFDFFGWTAVVLEFFATYYIIWPKDGRMKKEDIRKMYDGSLFYEIAAKRYRQRRRVVVLHEA